MRLAGRRGPRECRRTSRASRTLVKIWSSSPDEARRPATKPIARRPACSGYWRPIASGGKRLPPNRTQEVAGSSPARSTASSAPTDNGGVARRSMLGDGEIPRVQVLVGPLSRVERERCRRYLDEETRNAARARPPVALATCAVEVERLAGRGACYSAARVGRLVITTSSNRIRSRPASRGPWRPMRRVACASMRKTRRCVLT
jgi:hypothetical protein